MSMTTTADAPTDRSPLTMRLIRRLGIGFVYTGSILPLLALVNFYSFVLRARLAGGAWPSHETGPDHASFGFAIQDQLIGASCCLPLVFVSWFVSAAGIAWVAPEWLPRRRFLFLSAFWFVPLGVAIIDLGGFVHWYFFYSN